MGETHTLARDEKARKSEQRQTWAMGNSTHKLETRR
jgi:hypothetical protein